MPEGSTRNRKWAYSLGEVLEEEFVALHGELPPGCGYDGPQRLNALFGAIHKLKPERRALCLSGGGIRSATFSLGVLEAFARHKLLESFHYLSTVSGGGYIGGWLSAWMTRAAVAANDPVDLEAGAKAVIQQLAAMADSRPTAEPEPVRNLRRYSNYLSPRIGVLSADSWALGLTFVRNLLLTWVVLLPALAAVMLLPQVYRWLAEPSLGSTGVVRTTLVAAILLGLTGLVYANLDLPSRFGRGWSVHCFKLWCLLPFALAALLFSLVWAWRAGIASEPLSAWHFVLGGAILNFLSALGGLVGGWKVAQRAGTQLRWIGRRVLDLMAVLVSGGVAGGLIWIGAYRVFPPSEIALNTFVVFAPAWVVLSLLLATAAYVGLASAVTNEDEREWWGRAGAWLSIAAIVWMATASIAVFARPALGQVSRAWLAAGGASGVVTAFIGYRSSTALGNLARVRGTIRSILERYGLSLGAGLFVLALLMAVAAATGSLVSTLRDVLLPAWSPAAVGTLFFLTLVAAAFLLSWLIGVNRFSLHSMYGTRLVRAYLGASQKEKDRHPFPLTGFDPNDNMLMHELHRGRPLHVVNLTLNLVRGDELAWQQRRAKSFTVTRLHCGSWYGTEPDALSYRPANRYGDREGISLGKAVAISGAAVSPNMGYHSSPLVALVMTFFNARLGWWLGNPNARISGFTGDPGKRTWERDEPRFGLRPLIAEALRLTTDTSPYVYLSDGGHFENLGLYEMVLRRCGLIVVVDAGCDPKREYEDLSAAIRKIRSDFGIPVTMTQMPSDTQPWGEGKIHYGAVDAGAADGLLVCLKPIVTPEAPLDVQRYAATHANPKNPFPQQTTADQFFDESQFESYHALGNHVGDLVARSLIAGPTGRDGFRV